jgi:hypothetical protein
MEKFANQSEKERQDILQEAARRRDVTDVIIEKDFWVCWTLKRLVGNPDLAPHLIFKGGTSLSKAYRLIQRFSEDIDLTINRDAPYLSKGSNPMEDGISSKERQRRIEDLKKNAQLFVEKLVLSRLQEDIATALNWKDNWRLILDTEDSSRQTLLFYYPKVFSYSESEYIKPHIKLEFGARGETEPHESKTISPYVVQEFPAQFIVKEFSTPTLAIERSFWEKATILHALHHGSNMRDRMSRHYYDTFQMAKAGIAQAALANPTLLEQVVRNKTLMFRDTKASYETAKIGSIKLVPRPENINPLKKDYAAMEEMFMAEYPSFETIMEGLATVENFLNKIKFLEN